MLREQETRKAKMEAGNSPSGRLAFVTVGALLGIKAIRRDAEHIVALDADPMDDRADDGTGLERMVLARCVRISGFYWNGIG